MATKLAFSDRELLGFSSSPGNQVATVLTFLKERRFFPFGKTDDLCGYRTASSMRSSPIARAY